MTEQIAANIFRIGVTLPGNPLKELNSYFIRGEEGDLLIDTGFRNDVCREALDRGLRELGSEAGRRDVLITHLHSDHSGMADLFVGPGRRIFLGKTDLEALRGFTDGDMNDLQHRRFISEGLPEELARQIFSVNPANQQALPGIPSCASGLNAGDVLTVGEYRLETIPVPGHTPGNCVFWCRDQGIFFSGDHVLFDITPNITNWPKMEDPLGDYLKNLRRLRGLPVKQTLPGHRKTGDFGQRVDHLLEHHRARLEESQRIVAQFPGLTAYEITAQMRWRIRSRGWEDFPIIQKWFAMGECIAHLDHLRLRGRVGREQRDGVWRYHAVEG